ncbi:MAG TPA: AAA family ATPase [Mycobacteriales bacterium]
MSSSWPGLRGRRAECDRLAGLVAAAKAGRSQVLVLRGEAGIGKTALLDFLLARAAGCRVARAAGVESEMELAFSGLHQLCGPYLDRLAGLPGPQRDALGAAFGLRAGHPPDRYLVGLSVLTLLSEVAEERPLVCVVDDAQWLDQASAQALEVLARRLAAEPVALVLAARRSGPEPRFAELPELDVPPLGDADAGALLDSAVTGALDPRVRDRILAECHGNPLALLELPRGLSPVELAFGGTAGSTATSLVRRLEEGFRRQANPLPEPSRRLLLTAAAEPIGDVALVRSAVERLGMDLDAAAADTAGLVELGDRVRFRHPLVRSALYGSATRAERRQVHRALADATDPDLDPDRRAWHRARAAAGADEAVAADLVRSADRALARGGLAAAAAFLEQAAALTPDPVRRALRSLDAAQAKASAGSFPEAARLLAAAGVGPLGAAERARVELLEAQLAFAERGGNEALPLLLAAARRLEPLDRHLAGDTYLDALSAALFAGRLTAGPDASAVARAVRAATPADPPRKGDTLLDGLAVLFTDGYAPAAPLLRRAVQAYATEDLTTDEAVRSAWLAAVAAVSLWDDTAWDALTGRHLDFARRTGALGAMPLALNTRTVVQLFTGNLAAAASLVEETRSITEVTRSTLAPYGEVGLLALRGDPEPAETLIQQCLDDVVARGEGVGIGLALWARAVLANGLGRYGDAFAAAREAAVEPLQLGVAKWALAELVEAGARTGDVRAAAAAAEELTALTTASGTDWALGVQAGRCALLHRGRAAEDRYREAVDRLSGTRVEVELARTRLLYGEWLRREGRRVDARAELRAAYERFTAMGAGAFAERARHELRATGETVQRRTFSSPAALTAQEAHIARLAAQGLTNPQIGVALYISPRTVEWHLRKVFAKLGVSTRMELRRFVPDADR